MRILSLDAARTTGWAFGEGSEAPVSGSVRLTSGEDYQPEDLAASLAFFLVGKIRSFKPDVISVEKYLPPGLQMSSFPVVTSLLLHGGIAAMCGLYKIPLVTCTTAQFRKHFCGRSTANPVTRGGRTPRQKAADRAANKALVLDRCKLLGWLPKDCTDDNRADAIAIWSWSMSMYSKYDLDNPPTLVMFNE